MPALNSPSSFAAQGQAGRPPYSAATTPPPSQEVKDQFPLLMAADSPNVAKQFDEFQRGGGMSLVCAQRDRNDRIRFNRWRGRTSDFRKHRKALAGEPVPWENAWDGRVYMADGVIEDMGDVLSSAFERAKLKARPTEASDTQRAGMAEIVLAKYRERMRASLSDESEYLWQFGLNNGCAVWEVGWDRALAMKHEPVTMDQLLEAGLAAQEALMSMPPSEVPPDMLERMAVIAQLGEVILDPAREGEAVDLLQMFAHHLAAQLYAPQRRSYGDEWLNNYELSRRTARRVVRELRATGHSRLPAPYLARNQPFACAREVGYDYFCPPEMTDPQDASWHAVRNWLTPEQLMARRATDGWDPHWVDEAIKTAGQTSVWGDAVFERDQTTFEGDSEVDAYDWHTQDTKSGLVEVVWFYKRYISAEGVPEVWCTVWCPHVIQDPMNPAREDFAAAHYEYDLLPGMYPFVGYRWQKKKRQFINSTGVPQIVGSDQHSVKTSLDMLVDRQEMEVNPSWMVDTRLGMRYKAGPGAQIPRKRAGDLEPLQLNAGSPALAFNLIEAANQRTAEYFGLMRETVLPAKWQSKLQRMTERYLGACAQMWCMVLKLIQRNADAAELERIAGADPEFPTSPEDIAGEFDISLYFDVKDLDMEFVFKKLEAIINMAVPVDRAGLIDSANLVRMIMAAIDPSYSNALLQSDTSASQKLFQDTRNQVSLLMQGNMPDMVENDPTAAKQLEYAQQIIFGDGSGKGGNPIYQQALRENPVVQERFDAWVQNRQQSVKQEKNKQIGRDGVDVEAVA